MAKSVKQPVETPPYLKQVRIRDYAPLRDAKVDFKPGLNIIIGSNGTGKTRFLSLARQLADPYREPIEGQGCELELVYGQQVKILFQAPENTLKPRDVSELRHDDNALLQIKAKVGGRSQDGKYLDDAFYLITGIELRYESVMVRHGVPVVSSPLLDKAASIVFGKNKKMKLDYEFTPGIFSHFSLLIGSIFFTLQRVWGGRADAFTNHFSTQETSVEEAKSLVKQVVDFFLQRLNEVLTLYSPIEAVRLSDVIQVYRNTVQDEIIINGLVLEYKVGGNWLPFSYLSDGTKRLFYIISQLVTQAVGVLHFNDYYGFQLLPSTRSKIIFLEEPELGIHPKQLTKTAQPHP